MYRVYISLSDLMTVNRPSGAVAARHDYRLTACRVTPLTRFLLPTPKSLLPTATGSANSNLVNSANPRRPKRGFNVYRGKLTLKRSPAGRLQAARVIAVTVSG